MTRCGQGEKGGGGPKTGVHGEWRENGKKLGLLREQRVWRGCHHTPATTKQAEEEARERARERKR